MVTKTQIINALEELPEDLSIYVVIDKIINIERVQNGICDDAGGCIDTTEEAKKYLENWLN